MTPNNHRRFHQTYRSEEIVGHIPRLNLEGQALFVQSADHLFKTHNCSFSIVDYEGREPLEVRLYSNPTNPTTNRRRRLSKQNVLLAQTFTQGAKTALNLSSYLDIQELST